MRWREGYVHGGATRFWVREAGRGEDVVVLLHGFPQSGDSWGRVAERLVADGWRVVAPDLKGVGRTDGDRTDFDPRTLGAEVSQLVRNLHARKALLVGHDWGGAVALATAFRHPGRVSGVVLLSAPYRQLDLRAAWHIAACNVPVLPEVAFRVASRPLVDAALRHQTIADPALTDEELSAAAEALAADPAAWLHYFRRLSRRAVGAWLVRRARRSVSVLRDPEPPNPLRVPHLVVWGEDDRVFPLGIGARVARDLACDLDVLPRVGHHPHLEAPGAVAASITAFAREHRLGPGSSLGPRAVDPGEAG